MKEMVKLNDEQLGDIAGGAAYSEYIQYTMRRGDTLSHLARVYHTTVDELVRINNIQDVNKIYEGDVILIPIR